MLSDLLKLPYHNIQCPGLAHVDVVIGTIDSFMFAMGDKQSSRNVGDFFQQLRMSIAERGYRGWNQDGMARYAMGTVLLNRECLVIIDEAQDLER